MKFLIIYVIQGNMSNLQRKLMLKNLWMTQANLNHLLIIKIQLHV